jgi:shikimate kinase
VVLHKENINALKENGIIIYIDRKLDNIMGDVDYESRPLLKNNNSNLQTLYKQRHHLYNKYSDIIINANYDIDTVMGIIRDVLREKL